MTYVYITYVTNTYTNQNVTSGLYCESKKKKNGLLNSEQMILFWGEKNDNKHVLLESV